MYSLKTNNQSHLFNDPKSEASTARMSAQQKLRDSVKGLTFDPVPHKYRFGDEPITGVSSIVDEYAPFDTVACAKGVSKNPNHEHYGKSVEEIIAIWADKRDTAAAAGTTVHEFGEACYLIKSGREDMLEDKYRTRLTRNGLEAASPKEEAAALFWDDLDISRYVLVSKESIVFNPEYRYAGTFDLLLYDLHEHCYVLKDYKTNEDLFKWYGKHLKAPLTSIKDDDHGKYTLQQNLYALQLRNLGINVGRMELVWLKDTGQYQNVSIPDVGRLVKYALEVNKKLL